MQDFRHALSDVNDRILLLDGAMGTLLQQRGLPAGANPLRFSLEHPEIVSSIHRDYVQAGADILITNTFGGSAFKMPPDINVPVYNRTMAEAARAAAQDAGRPVFVAGNVGPCGHFVKPLGDLEPSRLIDAFREQIRGLAQGGVDLIFIETQFDLAEARAAVIAAHLECSLPVAVSMTFEQGVTLTGTTPEIFAATMRNLGVDALGVNCGAGPEEMLSTVRRLVESAQGIPVLAEANAGLPELIDGESVFRLSPEPFATASAAFAVAGVRLVGGCCGTSPAHIAALRAAVDNIGRQPLKSGCQSGIVLSSRSALVHIGGDAPLCLLGERINPTGKKQLSAEFQAGEFGLALRFAEEQSLAGAHVLDVNVGAPMVDETVLLPDLVQKLVSSSTLPLSLDSSNALAIERTLPYYPASALVNSISGESGRMAHLGPLCRLYGAPFVLLPLQGRDLPETAAERIGIIEKLLQEAENHAIPRHLIMVDVLALAVSSRPDAGRQCLDTIRWCTQQGLPTTIGLSNISFGLPAREIVNATFFAMAAGAGLSSCIGHPANLRLKENLDAANVLLAHDPDAARFITQYGQWKNTGNAPAAGNVGGTSAPVVQKTLESAVIHGDRENILALVESALAAGEDPFVIVNERLIPAITEVGTRYERKEYFLPQLLRSAETMQAAFARLQPLLEEKHDATVRPVIVLATVEGDIHDIGKNIVALMLSNHGFEVLDLGKDVPAQEIVRMAAEHNASLIGLSALMTTTMVRMEETITLLKERGMDTRVIIGGAVVTEAFATAIGADGFARDAVAAVRLAQSLA